MKGSRIKDIAKDWADDVEVFIAFYDKDEADDYIESNFEDNEPLTQEEWLEVVRLMDIDDSIWHELNHSFQWSIEQTINKRKGNNGNNQ